MTTIDGYQMAKKGRAGAALAVSALGSFIAGTLGVVGLTLFALPLASMALKFGPAEYFTPDVLRDDRGVLARRQVAGQRR